MTNFCRSFALLVILSLFAQAKENITGWNVREPAIRDILVAGSFASNEVGWVCGIQTMLHTKDGGKTWFQQLPEEKSEQAYWFTSVQALSATTAMATAAGFGSVKSGALLRTENGGQNWAPLAMRDGVFTSLKFRKNKRTGYLVSSSDGLMKSVDGGLGWLPVRTPEKPTPFKKSTQDIISLPDERTIWLCGEKSLMVSHDDGESWAIVPLPLGTQGQFYHMSFATASHGWVTMLEGETLETRDGGKTWAKNDTVGQYYALTPNLVWMLSNTNALRSNDGGRTWTRDLQVDHRRGRLISIVHTDSRLFVLGGAQARNQPFLADRGINIDEDVAGPQGQVPIAFVMPTQGHATVQVLDQQNRVVNNVLSGVPLGTGGQRVLWDLTTVDDYWGRHEQLSPHLYTPPDKQPKLVTHGTYRWRGLHHRGIVPQYHFSFLPIKDHGMPWLSSDGTGGWVGDVEPAKTIVRGATGMWLGAFAKKGDAIIHCTSDTRKLWGAPRTQLACPDVLAYDGNYVYYIDDGDRSGRGLVLVQVDAASKVSRRIVVLDPNGSNKYEVTGLAVSGSRVYISNRASNQILIGYLDRAMIDGSNTAERLRDQVPDNVLRKFPIHQPHDFNLVIIDTISFNKPGRIRNYNGTHLAAVGDGGVSLIDKKLYTTMKVVQNLTNPLGLEVDGNGNFYVGEMAPQHQVKVFAGDGRQLRTIGLVGPHRVGRFNPNNLESPAGLALDSSGLLWVCEGNSELRRVSIWNSDGQCVRQVIGPAIYGGGGALDPRDANRFFYEGKEFRRDPSSKRVTLTHILWRQNGFDYDRFAEPNPYNVGGIGPGYPFYNEDRLFFSRTDSYGNGNSNTLWLYADEHLRPVSAVGASPPWLVKKFGGPGQNLFAWSDGNNDGKVQKTEVQFSTLPAGGSLWGSRMNHNFELAFSSQSGQAGIAFFRPSKATALGYPLYDLPDRFVPMPGVEYRTQHSVQSLLMDRMGRAIVCGPYIASVNNGGGVNWRYENRWPGLSGGLFNTATGAEPGLLIGSTRFLGSVDLGHTIGEIVFLANNFGSIDMFTSDGLYVGRVFHDQRRGNRWTSNSVPGAREMASYSLGQEHFGGSVQAVRGHDGRTRVFLIASGAGGTASLVELMGLDTIRRFKGDNLAVFTEQVARAREQLARRRSLTRTARHHSIPARSPKVDGDLSDWPPEGDMLGVRLSYDANHLYVAYDRKFGRPAFANASTTNDFLESFKRGDYIDIQLGTKADLKDTRTTPTVGDIRLCITKLGNKYGVILYDYMRSHAGRDEHVHFHSRWRNTVCNHVELLEDAHVVARQGQRFQLEAVIPLADIGLKPKAMPRIRGDVGIGLADQTGSRTVERVFWSNPYSHLYSDLPSEALIYPAYWGTLHFTAAK